MSPQLGRGKNFIRIPIFNHTLSTRMTNNGPGRLYCPATVVTKVFQIFDEDSKVYDSNKCTKLRWPNWQIQKIEKEEEKTKKHPTPYPDTRRHPEEAEKRRQPSVVPSGSKRDEDFAEKCLGIQVSPVSGFRKRTPKPARES